MNTHHKKQSFTQSSWTTLGNTAAADIGLARLVRSSVNTVKSNQSLLGVGPTHITNFSISCGPSTGPTPNIPMTTGYSGKEAAKDCISGLSEASAAEVAWSCTIACCTKSLVVWLEGITPTQLHALAWSSSAFSWLNLYPYFLHHFKYLVENDFRVNLEMHWQC